MRRQTLGTVLGVALGAALVCAGVAMAATIAAVYPHMNHIGGDGFWLVREPSGRVRAFMAAGRARMKSCWSRQSKSHARAAIAKTNQ